MDVVQDFIIKLQDWQNHPTEAGISIFFVLVVVFLLKGGEKRELVTERKVEKQFFTEDDVAKHAKEGDCWIIMEGKVYDVSIYMEGHPGGEDAVLQYAGKDATEGFRGPQHGPQVDDVIANYYIGDLVKK